MLRKLLLPALLCCSFLCASAQPLLLEGNVFGYKGEKVAILKKAQKNVSFDGGLEGTAVTLLGPNGTNKTVTTGLSGSFQFMVPAPGMYTIKFFHSGYSSIDFNVNYTEAGKRRSFGSLVILLKQESGPDLSLGTYTIADGGRSEFSINMTGTDKAKNDIFQTNTALLKKAADVNNAAPLPKLLPPPVKDGPVSNTPTQVSKDSAAPSPGKYSHAEMITFKDSVTPDLDSIRLRLDEARRKMAGMDTSSAAYRKLRQEVKIVEQYLEDKERIITLQDSEIAQAHRKITWLILFVVMAVAGAGLLLYFLQQRKKFNAELKDKNAKISKVNTKLFSSIRYASVIQKSFLHEKENIRLLFPDSFILNQPRDILSGDFYWFGRRDGHRIAIVADCTGHGVPGAMLTVLGHNALEEAITKHGEVVPSRILMELNRKIQSTFSRNADYLEYGMDITVISMKDNAGELLVSGVANGLYKVKAGGGCEYIRVTPKSLGAEIGEGDLVDQRVPVEKGDCLFMTTDGYLDQFSANELEVEKFGLKRFQDLLEKIASEKKLDTAESQLKKELDDWKGSRDQVDDVMVMGLRI
jgi:serine phosphatase RsbU (regulator of sigma subunit)